MPLRPLCVYNKPRFTKWTFVWGKNPQRHHIPYWIQLFILSMKIISILKLKQRFMSYFKYFNFYLHFCLFIQDCRKLHQESRNLTCDVFVFIFSWILFVNRRMWSKNYSKWKMEAIWRSLDLQSWENRFWIQKKILYYQMMMDSLGIFVPNKSSFCESWNLNECKLCICMYFRNRIR